MIGAASYLPEVSLIMPFEPVISLKKELQHRLNTAVKRVETELMANYPKEKAMPVVLRLKELVSHLDFDTRKKGLAIFVSPVIEKVFYVDFPVEEKCIIDSSFEIRDLVYSKKHSVGYLVLMLSGDSFRIYLGNSAGFTPLRSGEAMNIEAYERDMPEKIANFSDPDMHRQVTLDNFLHHIDQGLTRILKEYPLPVFVIGVEKLLGHFKKMTVNEKSLVGFIHGNYMEASETTLRELMEPYRKDWQAVKERASLLRLEEAAGDNKLEFGIKPVWQAATQKKGRLLIVEKDFVYPGHEGSVPESIYKEDLSLNNPFFIKDAVDDIISKVLDAGGDVEFVSNGVMREYGRIALIRFF